MKIANIYPNRISVYSKREVSYNSKIENQLKALNPVEFKDVYKNSKPQPHNLRIKKHSFNLSKNSRKNLIDSVGALVALSNPRTIFRKNRKPIYNYRASFITLTLPSVQEVSDVKIKECLNLFFTDLRRVYKLKNYVWKAELQKNGNIHFHVIIDVYIDYSVLLNYWLKALRFTNQISNYAKKFSKMSFRDYRSYRLKNSKGKVPTFNQLQKAYAYGKKTKWLKPNCVDVRSVYNVNQMSAYVAKYMAKNPQVRKSRGKGVEFKEVMSVNEIIRAKNFGKVWSRSTSLSAIKFKFPINLSDIQPVIDELIKTKAVFVKIYDYATCYYFNFKKMSKKMYAYINSNIINLGITFNYPFVT